MLTKGTKTAAMVLVVFLAARPLVVVSGLLIGVLEMLGVPAAVVERLMQLLTQVETWSLWLTGILWWSWFYNLAVQAEALEGEGSLGFKPKWTWVWWIVPIAKLFMPYQQLKAVWTRLGAGPGWLPGLWWGLWLVRTVVMGLSRAQETMAEMHAEFGSEPGVVLELLSFGGILVVAPTSALVAAFLVYKLTDAAGRPTTVDRPSEKWWTRAE